MKTTPTILVLFCSVIVAVAAVPQQINYQGTLTRSDGSPLDTTVAITFSLYADSTGESPLWSEIHPAVSVVNGLFNRNIGINEPIPDTILHTSRLWLGITVGSDPEMQPRVKVASTFFARRSGQVDSLKAENVQQILALFQSLPDADGDGHTKLSMGGDDCDDLNPLIYPGATEICDRVDNNCNGQIDEGFTTLWYRDADADGYGNSDSVVVSCESVPGYVSIGGDCRDDNLAFHPGAEEVCDLLDNNCDGIIEQVGYVYPDADGDGYGAIVAPQIGCVFPGWSLVAGDCNDADSTIHPNRTEVCDGIDEDCDGFIDNDTPGCTVYFLDADSDGWGDDYTYFCLCAQQPPYTVTHGGDCFDNSPHQNPGMPECENGLDDNCDGIIDPPGSPPCTVYYIDFDQDGFGDASNSQRLCVPYWPFNVTQSGDCNDSNPNIHPGATEICNNGIDDDCNGLIDGADPQCP